MDDILSIDGDTAFISIKGLLKLDGPSPIELYYGVEVTAYAWIHQAFDKIGSYDYRNVANVVLLFNTPGGQIDGLDQIYQRIFSARDKYNVVAYNEGLMASAGYYLASAASSIVAASPAALTGSVGVKATWYDWTGLFDKAGIKEVEIISTNAPRKTPKNQEGLNAIQDELNALERIFFRRISEGRGIPDLEYLKMNFGRGGTLVAADPDDNMQDAVKVGMIDKVVERIE